MKEGTQGIYIHIPFCRSKCAYCDFVSGADPEYAPAYLNALSGEMRERLSGKAETVYIGGGTPSVLPRGMLTRIMSELRECVELTPDCEITVEANPDSCDGAFVKEITDMGANRLSIGVQSLNDSVLRGIGRRHNAAQAAEAVSVARKEGLSNINCDLMIGLPMQLTEDVRYAVNTLCDWGITHVSVYALMVEDDTPLGKSGYRADDDAAADMYEAAASELNRRGFERYEVSNFCKPGFFGRHNYGYWTRKPYVGLGVAAHSFDGKSRSFNTSSVSEYIRGNRDEKITELTARDELEELIMLGLRTRDGVDFDAIERVRPEWRRDKKSVIEELTRCGFIEPTDRGLKLADSAYYVMNDIIVKLI